MQFYTFENLNSLRGQTLTLTDAQGNQAMLVIDHVAQGKLQATGWDAFALHLCGPEHLHVPQGCYLVEHPKLGAETLFISPKSAVQYEIIFSKAKI